jgi:hypothetical protein
MQTLTLSVLVIAGLIQMGLCGWMIRSFRTQQELGRRLGALTDALSLLTETSEAGFRAGAVEIARIAERAETRRAPTRRATASRVARARKRGQSVEQIAATEQMSEGEVHLRLSLQDQAAGGVVVKSDQRRKAGEAGLRPSRRRTGAPEPSHS